jgi:hypothetical protein
MIREISMRYDYGRIARLVLCVALAAVVVGCDGGEDEKPRISPGDTGFSAAILPNRQDGSPYPAVGFFGLCLDRPGSVEIVDVTLEHSEGGLKIDTFALTPKSEKELPVPVSDTETLEELGLHPGSSNLHTRCPSDATNVPSPSTERDRGYTDLALQFSKSTNGTARGGIIHIRYKSGDEILTHRIGFGIVLCEGDSDKRKVPGCEYDDYGWE